MMKFLNRSNKKGFTLIELLVVIAIIGILASVVLASLNSARKKGRDARRIADIKQIQLASELYFDANSTYPPTATWETAISDGGFMTSVPKDPLTAVSYKYILVSATDYRLGAILEDNANPALDSDADGTTTGFDGSGVDCVAAGTPATELCYDVRP